MSLEENLSSDIQKLEPSAMVELFELDTTSLGGEILRFHNGTNKLSQNIVWRGEEYVRFPIQITGFEISGQGQFPRPRVIVSNVMSAITTVLLQYKDLLGAKVTRKRTLLKYLDAVNFPGGVNPAADPDVFFPDDVYYVDRKSLEDRDQVQLELASAADLQGVKVPQRVVIKSTCPWIYRGSDCGYTGVPLYDQADQVLPAPSSAEAIAMRAAYQDLLDAQTDLAVAQADLAVKSNALTAAQQYTIETRYGQSPKNYVSSTAYGLQAFWDNVSVALGSTYSQGEATESFVASGLQTNFFQIRKYSRDEGAVTTAQTNYNNAVTARDTAQSDLVTARNTFDVALAAVPSDDPVYSQDRCGKRLNSCRIRFDSITPNSPLNFGGFPGVSR